MPIYQITIIVQSDRSAPKNLSKSVMAALTAQSELPLFALPDLAPDQELVQIEQRRGDISLTCHVSCPSAAELDQRLRALCAALEEQLRSALSGSATAELNIAGFAEPHALSMPLELVLQGPTQLYAVYRSGAVYALGGREALDALEDPTNPLFQDGTLRKLAAAEAHQVLNSRDFTHVWSRHGSRNRSDPGPKSGENWLIRQT